MLSNFELIGALQTAQQHRGVWGYRGVNNGGEAVEVRAMRRAANASLFCSELTERPYESDWVKKNDTGQ